MLNSAFFFWSDELILFIHDSTISSFFSFVATLLFILIILAYACHSCHLHSFILVIFQELSFMIVIEHFLASF